MLQSPRRFHRFGRVFVRFDWPKTRWRYFGSFRFSDRGVHARNACVERTYATLLTYSQQTLILSDYTEHYINIYSIYSSYLPHYTTTLSQIPRLYKHYWKYKLPHCYLVQLQGCLIQHPQLTVHICRELLVKYKYTNNNIYNNPENTAIHKITIHQSKRHT